MLTVIAPLCFLGARHAHSPNALFEVRILQRTWALAISSFEVMLTDMLFLCVGVFKRCVVLMAVMSGLH